MKRIITFLLIIVMFLSFNINMLNVKAEGEENETSETGENDDSSDESGDEGESGSSGSGDSTSLESDATLINITINGENIVCEKFVCEKIITDNEVTKATIKYELKNPKAKIEEGKESPQVLELKEGEDNELKVKVTSEDKTKTNTYTFKITKKVMSTDSTLKKLIVNGTEISLNENETKYKTTVSFNTKKLK